MSFGDVMKVSVNPKTIRIEEYERLVTLFPGVSFEPELNSCQDAEVLLCNPSFLTKEHLDQLPALKWVHLLMSGYNTVDLEDLKKRKIALTNSKDVFHIQIAEDVVAKISYFNRDLGVFHDQQKARIWKIIPDEYELYHSTVGIVGAGSIGSEIAKRLKAFDTTILGYRKNPQIPPYFDQIYTTSEGLDELITRSDYLIIAIPLNKETTHLINRKRLSLMKKTALLINVARGEIVDQEALIEALEHRAIRGAGLDVVYPEPLPKEHPLWGLSNVLLTSHNASSSQFMYRRIVDLFIENLSRFQENKPLLHEVIPYENVLK